MHHHRQHAGVPALDTPFASPDQFNPHPVTVAGLARERLCMRECYPIA